MTSFGLSVVTAFPPVPYLNPWNLLTTVAAYESS